jgi:hypothetical protein
MAISRETSIGKIRPFWYCMELFETIFWNLREISVLVGWLETNSYFLRAIAFPRGQEFSTMGSRCNRKSLWMVYGTIAVIIIIIIIILWPISCLGRWADIAMLQCNGDCSHRLWSHVVPRARRCGDPSAVPAVSCWWVEPRSSTSQVEHNTDIYRRCVCTFQNIFPNPCTLVAQDELSVSGKHKAANCTR